MIKSETNKQQQKKLTYFISRASTPVFFLHTQYFFNFDDFIWPPLYHWSYMIYTVLMQTESHQTQHKNCQVLDLMWKSVWCLFNDSSFGMEQRSQEVSVSDM